MSDLSFEKNLYILDEISNLNYNWNNNKAEAFSSKLIDKVKSKTFIESFEEQTELSEKLYGMNIHFNFNKKDIEDILESEDAKIYSKEERNRVKTILFEQMRKYPYLF